MNSNLNQLQIEGGRIIQVRNPARGTDPLYALRAYRRTLIDKWPAHMYAVRSTERRLYISARSLAMEPVLLPRDDEHLMPSAETCAYFNALAHAA